MIENNCLYDLTKNDLRGAKQNKKRKEQIQTIYYLS